MLLLNAALEKDSENYISCVESNIGNFINEHKDIWNFVVDFYGKYGETPSKEVVRDNFGSFEFVNVDNPIGYYIDQARRESLGQQVRNTLFHATEMMRRGDDPMDIMRVVQSESFNLMRDSGTMLDTDMTDWRDFADTLRERIENPDNSIVGVSSGISTIDLHFGGWQPGDFVVVIGWTGVGKSALTRLFAANAWRAGYRPLIISLEMDKLQEISRMHTILNGGKFFTNTQLMNGVGIDIDQYTGWAEDTFTNAHPLHLVTSEGVDSADQFFVQAKIEQYKPDLVILDYHTLFEDGRNGGTETERAKNLSKDFKRIAVRNRVPVIDVSGVTMESGHNDRPPELNEIAWSKQLSYDADMVLAIHRQPDSEVFQVITRKVRRCPHFAFYLNWNLDTGSWAEGFDGLGGDFE